jgi:2Fe-2S ferredoxin
MSSIQITVIDREGVRTPGVEWEDDESLMECLVRNSYPILATCGGNASCSTCHSYLDEISFETAGRSMRTRRTCWTASPRRSASPPPG